MKYGQISGGVIYKPNHITGVPRLHVREMGGSREDEHNVGVAVWIPRHGRRQGQATPREMMVPSADLWGVQGSGGSAYAYRCGRLFWVLGARRCQSPNDVLGRRHAPDARAVAAEVERSCLHVCNFCNGALSPSVRMEDLALLLLGSYATRPQTG